MMPGLTAGQVRAILLDHEGGTPEDRAYCTQCEYYGPWRDHISDAKNDLANHKASEKHLATYEPKKKAKR